MNKKATFLFIFALSSIILICPNIDKILLAKTSSSFIVIVNEANPITYLSKDNISKIFLKKITLWKNGLSIFPRDLCSDSEVRKNFTRAIHGQSVASIREYWRRQIFSGQVVPPVEMSSEELIVLFVKRDIGAIGYVSSCRKIPKGVKVVNTVDRMKPLSSKKED